MTDTTISNPQAAVSPARARRIPGSISDRQGFDAAEHMALGDVVALARSTLIPGAYAPGWNGKILHVAPDIALTYGQIVAIAGDLYGDPEHPISNGKSDDERKNLFLAAFNTLVHCDRAELHKILGHVKEESDYIQDKLKQGVWPDQAYGQRDNDTPYAHDTGGWFFDPGGRYGDLAFNNYDHFGLDAVTAYTAGHQEAIARAKKLRGRVLQGTISDTDALRQLEETMAMNAFADHFLTDLFASGHVRVPRRALYDVRGWTGTKGPSAMAKHQHEEDNRYGLFVENAQGDRWQCFGDAHMMTPQGQENRARAAGAVIASSNEVWSAFERGIETPPADYKGLRLAPSIPLLTRPAWGDDPMAKLNYLPQFMDRGMSAHNTRIISVRKPMKDIDSREIEPLPAIPVGIFTSSESPIGHTADEAWNWAFSHARETYGPPASALPRPGKPAMLEPGYLANAGAKGRVRYAIIFAGQHPYPDGRTVEFFSEPGDWSDWFDLGAHPGRAPHIGIPADPKPGNRARATGVMLIRQLENTLPDMAYRRLALSDTDFADGNF